MNFSLFYAVSEKVAEIKSYIMALFVCSSSCLNVIKFRWDRVQHNDVSEVNFEVNKFAQITEVLSKFCSKCVF